MKDIKKRASELKNSNGNAKISNNDLLWYLIGEVDELKEKDSKQDAKISKLQGEIGILIVFVVGLIVKVICL